MKYSPFRHLGSVFYKRAPIQFTFFVTRRCNARCPFCFYLSRKNKSGDDQPELSLDEIQKISGSLGNLLWVAFSGGEIFLRNDLVAITEIFYKQNKPAIILFPTNGLLTGTIREKTEQILRKCPKSTIVVKLSLDGPEYLHDAIRGVEGSYQKTMETCQALGELLEKYPNFDLGINSVFCLANQDKMQGLIDSVSRLEHVRTHTVSLIRGQVTDGKQKEVDLDKYRQTIEIMESNLKKKLAGRYRFKGARLKAAQDILQRRLIYETARQQKQQLPCYAGRLNLVLTEVGDLYPCESFSMLYGNVRNDGYDIRKLLKTKEAKTIQHAIKEKGCFCTHECYFMTNILFNPWQYPALAKEYLQL